MRVKEKKRKKGQKEKKNHMKIFRYISLEKIVYRSRRDDEREKRKKGKNEQKKYR